MMDFSLSSAVLRETILAALIALGASGIAAPLVFRLLLRVRSRQTVSEYVPEHQAKQGTPTMGGIIVLVGLIAAGLVVRQVPISWFVLIVGFGLIGFLDDFVIPRIMPGKRGLGWIPKLAMQFAVAVAAGLLVSGVGPIALGVIAFVVVTFSNAFNLSDGMDGLAGGLAVILALSLGILGVGAGASPWHLPLCLALAMSCLPFLYLNAPPAKVFMGDVGALPIGAVLGWLFIYSVQSLSYPVPFPWVAAIVLLSLVLAAELIPVPLQILSVKLRGKRLFPKTPIHHAYQSAGWPETRVVALFHIVQLVLAVVAVSLFFLLTPSWRGE